MGLTITFVFYTEVLSESFQQFLYILSICAYPLVRILLGDVHFYVERWKMSLFLH